MEAGYEMFDHTADMGLRVFAASPAELIQPATEALYAAIGEVVAGAPADAIELRFDGDDRAVLLRDYLSEVLALFERDRRRVTSVLAVTFGASLLKLAAETAVVDDGRSSYHREVKAITYHELAIRRIKGGYEAILIVDI